MGLWISPSGTVAAPLHRPLSGKGPEATTLLVYADQRATYSLGDSLELLTMQLLRVATRVELVSAAQATPERMALADYLVVFCPQSAPALTTNFLQAIAEAKQPLLWIGFGADQLENLGPFKGGFQASSFAAPEMAAGVNYRGRDWSAPVSPWIPATITSNSLAKVTMSIRKGEGEKTPARPICWQIANATFFAAIPRGGPIGFLFEDLLLDFYQAKEIPAAQLFIRVEDYHGGSDHRELRRMADFLYSRHLPFLLAVVPSTRDPETGKIDELDSQPEFLQALQYAQARGGRLVLKGFTYPPAGNEFWNMEQDRPPADENPDRIRERLHKFAGHMLEHRLFPLAWETPGYAASRKAYTQIGAVFSTAVEQIQLSDSTRLESGVSAGLTLDRAGRLIVPENMGFALDADAASFDGIRAMGEVLTRLRGSIGGCYCFAYQPLAKLTGLVDALAEFHTPYLDLAEMDNAVQLPGSIFLSGQAQRSVTLRNATVKWQAFDRAGKRIAEETETAQSSGLREFKRRGVGDYELFQFSESNP